MKIPRIILGVTLALLLGLCPAFAQERKDIPEESTWNISDLYSSKGAWDQAREGLAGRLGEMRVFRGRLGSSAATLLKALETREDLEKEIGRVGLYANMMADVDTRDSQAQAMLQAADKLGNDFATEAAFFVPELLELGDKAVQDFIRSEPGLVSFKPVLDNILRQRKHTLTPAEEKVVAQAASITGASSSLYKIFTAAEMPFPEVELSDGKKVRLDQAAYGLHRASPVRADRLKVFQAFWQTWQAYRSTLATALFNHVKTHVLTKDLRGYESCMAAALDTYNIPTSVYHQLVRDVNGNLPTLHRYLGLRKRMMGLDQIGYEDLYAPTVKAVDMAFTPQEAMELTLESTALLGPEYQAALKKAYAERWVDWKPSVGKRSGAYSTGAYDVHPYQLLNYYGQYDDVSTLAHESGHSMHTYLSNKNQRYATSDYSIFVAEVASTLNEDMLFHDMLDRAKDDETRLFLLGERLETFRTTLFRQTLFAEFELAIHEMVEKGEPLTGDSLNKVYLDLARRYYGHDAGICDVDALYGAEWAFIPHFYYNFYVYQYATSLMASSSIAAEIRQQAAKGSTQARDAYLHMLSSGSSRDPVDLLKGAGVDMNTSAPFKAAMREMNTIMDQMETILNKSASASR